jgi:hypothetical protein
LGQITNDLRSWSDLDDIAEEIVGLLVGLLGLCPLCAKSLLRSLEDQVGELATRNLVLVDFRVGSGEAGLEGRVNQTDLSPIADELLMGFKEEDLENHLPVNCTEVLGVETSLELAALKGCRDCPN